MLAFYIWTSGSEVVLPLRLAYSWWKASGCLLHCPRRDLALMRQLAIFTVDRVRQAMRERFTGSDRVDDLTGYPCLARSDIFSG